jgi:hypothetical protein
MGDQKRGWRPAVVFLILAIIEATDLTALQDDIADQPSLTVGRITLTGDSDRPISASCCSVAA